MPSAPEPSFQIRRARPTLPLASPLSITTRRPNNNSAFGYGALHANTTGTQNEGFGYEALFTSSTGNGNAAFGTGALFANTTGGSSGTTGGNSAFGNFALLANTTAGGNSAFGFSALTANTIGANNVAVGAAALASLTTGNGNVAIGTGAGGNLNAAESNDIYVGNSGIAGESNTIRIGYIGTATAAYIAGISGKTSANGVDVLINGAGQLGTVKSSLRYKHEIADMGVESDVLMKLRPVAFYYKPELDDTQTRQYGLVAEEVAKVAPELVVFGEDGTPETVRYHFVNAMLLNEVQKQRQLVEEQQKTNDEQNSKIARQHEEIQDLAARVAKLEALLAAK
jgi:Chaperone of endosialidase